MSDEVRSNSSPTPPQAGGSCIDAVDAPKSLEIEFPTPDLEASDAESDVGPGAAGRRAAEDAAASGVAALPTTSSASQRPRPGGASAPLPGPGQDLPPRSSERPPPPSQRVAQQSRMDTLVTPVPPAPSPAPITTTLPAPAPVLHPSPAAVSRAAAVSPAAASPAAAVPPAAVPPAALPSAAVPPAAVPPAAVPPAALPSAAVPAALPSAAEPPAALPPAAEPPAALPPSADASLAASAPDATLTEPAPPPRMLSEPVPLTRATAAPATKYSLRPGLVEPKRIIEVLGSNVPVLDSALEEEAIEDLDESEAYEVAESPFPEAPISLPDADLELPVVVEDDIPPEAPDGSRAAAAAEGREGARAVPPPPPGPAEAVGAPGPLDSAGTEAGDAPGQRAKAPPNKRRRPPPPSSRSAEVRKVDPSPPGARKWWEEMFSEEFLRAIPILSPKQLDREVNFIEEALAADRGARVLDLACGAGQHAVELAARGYDLVGYDLSQSQLDWAGGLAQERNQRLQFTYGDMRDLSYQESFDAIYSWNTSFGFFEEEKNVDVVQRVFRALRPGGRFLLDVINRDFVVAQQPGQTWFEGDGCVCIDDVSIDFITSRMKVKRTLMLTNGKNRECNYSVRIYGLHELGKILHDVGFKVLNVSGRPEMPGVFFGATSPRVIILAVKP